MAGSELNLGEGPAELKPVFNKGTGERAVEDLRAVVGENGENRGLP